MKIPKDLKIQSQTLPETQETNEKVLSQDLSGQQSPTENDSVTHFDELLIAPEASGLIDDGSGIATVPEAQLSKEEFHKAFCMAFNVTSSVTRLKSLAVDPKDGVAIAASEAIFETASEIPALSFLLSPGGKWGGRAIVVAAFVIPIATGVREELSARKTKIVPDVAAENFGKTDILKKFNN